MDALNAGHWENAVAAFSRALDLSGDDPDFVLARGVACTLNEDFLHAQQDFERAPRVSLKGREARLWIWATKAMSGNLLVPDHALGGGPGSLRSQRPAVVSIPGPLAQGGKDYSSGYGTCIVYQLAMAYQDHGLPADFGESGNPNGATSPPMRQAILKAGQRFAERNYRRPELTALNVSRAKPTAGRQPATGPLAHVERALAGNPGDPDAHCQAGYGLQYARSPSRQRTADSPRPAFSSLSAICAHRQSR